LGPTKTLAKLANRLSKRHPHFQAVVVCNLADLPAAEAGYAAELEVEAVWGIGARRAARLQQRGIVTEADLRRADPARLHRDFNVVLARTALEFNGVSCLTLEETPPPRQQIIASRSFGGLVTDLAPLRGAAAKPHGAGRRHAPPGTAVFGLYDTVGGVAGGEGEGGMAGPRKRRPWPPWGVIRQGASLEGEGHQDYAGPSD
jgi:DNA polymerase V